MSSCQVDWTVKKSPLEYNSALLKAPNARFEIELIFCSLEIKYSSFFANKNVCQKPLYSI